VTKKNDYARVFGVIQSDKSVMSDSCKTLVLQDFARLISEYFELRALPEMEIVSDGNGYDVTITFQAERVKKFNVLK
jgi:hypothetical protein